MSLETKNKEIPTESASKVTLVECPRDAIQGISYFIPTEKKIEYLNLLLASDTFDIIDFGSFVSPKAIPQMSDTAVLIPKLNLENTHSKLLAIIANERGANEACQFQEVSYLGYPFSISETFQQRNTNASIADSFERVKTILHLCSTFNKELVIYISMGFGNPYGDVWNAEIALHWVEQLKQLGIKIFSLSDTVGVASPENISYLFKHLTQTYPELTFGVHLHTTPTTWREKVQAAWEAGCRRFDGAILGYGGCPMAADELVGNMATENLLAFFREHDPIFSEGKYPINKLQMAFNELIVH